MVRAADGSAGRVIADDRGLRDSWSNPKAMETEQTVLIHAE
ncbi:MAG: hypothetical protein VX871_01180 [Pseudomonadota bacterium]|nr:hypothetical protein [Pseudomonadota bacterium]